MDLDSVYRAEYGRCVATLTRLVGDIGLTRLGRTEDAIAAYDEAIALATNEPSCGHDGRA